ncbi:UvrABC system protein C [Striga asiatica]|uniref:UvrABC system protein C n=1 Tax=Striga asiatica TaxID=4170 RepID=A0A5A7PYL2_STRAF|nr:UvrABC system protein C [Striga asiatica]
MSPELNIPFQEFGPLLSISKSAIIQFLALKLTKGIVTNWVPFFINAVHINNLFETLDDIFFIEELFDFELLPPRHHAFEHGESFLHLEVPRPKEFQEDSVALLVCKEADAPDGDLLRRRWGGGGGRLRILARRRSRGGDFVNDDGLLDFLSSFQFFLDLLLHRLLRRRRRRRFFTSFDLFFGFRLFFLFLFGLRAFLFFLRLFVLLFFRFRLGLLLLLLRGGGRRRRGSGGEFVLVERVLNQNLELVQGFLLRIDQVFDFVALSGYRTFGSIVFRLLPIRRRLLRRGRYFLNFLRLRLGRRLLVHNGVRRLLNHRNVRNHHHHVLGRTRRLGSRRLLAQDMVAGKNKAAN